MYVFTLVNYSICIRVRVKVFYFIDSRLYTPEETVQTLIKKTINGLDNFIIFKLIIPPVILIC